MKNQVNAVVPAAVSFHENTLITAEVNGEKYVAMKPIVEGMGMKWAAQFTKIKSGRYSDIEIPLKTPGGIQEMVCIPISKLNGWLFSINPEKVKSGIKNKVIQYQEECFVVLHDYWQKGEAVNPRIAKDRQIPASKPAPGFKRCPKCGEVKPVSEFSRDARNPTGLQGYCKLCKGAIKRAYAERNRQKNQANRVVLEETAQPQQQPDRETVNREDYVQLYDAGLILKTLTMEMFNHSTTITAGISAIEKGYACLDRSIVEQIRESKTQLITFYASVACCVAAAAKFELICVRHKLRESKAALAAMN